MYTMKPSETREKEDKPQEYEFRYRTLTEVKKEEEQPSNIGGEKKASRKNTNTNSAIGHSPK